MTGSHEVRGSIPLVSTKNRFGESQSGFSISSGGNPRRSPISGRDESAGRAQPVRRFPPPPPRFSHFARRKRLRSVVKLLKP